MNNLSSALIQLLQSGIILGGKPHYSVQTYQVMNWIRNESDTQFTIETIIKTLDTRLGPDTIPRAAVQIILDNLCDAHLMDRQAEHVNLYSTNQKHRIGLTEMKDMYTVTSRGADTLEFIENHADIIQETKLDPALFDEYATLVNILYKLDQNQLENQTAQSNFSGAFKRFSDVHNDIVNGMKRLDTELNVLLRKLYYQNDQPEDIDKLIQKLNAEAIPHFEQMLALNQKVYSLLKPQNSKDYITTIADSGEDDLADINVNKTIEELNELRANNSKIIEQTLERIVRDYSPNAPIANNNPHSIYRINNTINTIKTQLMRFQNNLVAVSNAKVELSAKIKGFLQKTDDLVLRLLTPVHLPKDREEVFSDLATAQQLAPVIYDTLNRPQSRVPNRPHDYSQPPVIDNQRGAKIHQEFTQLLNAQYQLKLDHDIEIQYPETRDLILKLITSTIPQVKSAPNSPVILYDLKLQGSLPIQHQPVSIHCQKDQYRLILPYQALYQLKKVPSNG